MATALTVRQRVSEFLHFTRAKKRSARQKSPYRSWVASLWTVMMGRVSRLLYYNARERFFTLKESIEHELEMMRQQARLPAPATGSDRLDPHRAVRKKTALVACLKMLDDHRYLLTRSASDLNRIWRVLTNVHVMILHNVMGDQKLVEQLEVCREEAYRLRVDTDSTVNRMLLRIAELTSSRKKIGANRPALIRALVATVQRLNSIRCERILYSHMNLRTYKMALLAVVVVSAGLIANNDVVVRGMKGLHGIAQSQETVEAPASGSGSATAAEGSQAAGSVGGVEVAAEGSDTSRALSPLLPAPAAAADAVPPAGRKRAWAAVTTRISAVRGWIAGRLARNVLAFVFFAGFAGGLFSVVTRVRTGGVTPGEDVYKAYYILTKPLVGAFGALLLFILLGGGLVTSSVIQAVAEPTVQIFGFGILAGFSERIVFPKLQ